MLADQVTIEESKARFNAVVIDIKADAEDGLPQVREIGLRADLLSMPQGRLSSWINAGKNLLRSSSSSSAVQAKSDAAETSSASAALGRWQQVSMVREPVGTTVNLLCDEPIVRGTLLELAVPRLAESRRPPMRIRIGRCEPGGSGGFFYVVHGEVEQ